MQWKKLGLALLILPFLSSNIFADDVDEEIKRLEKEKKRLELKKEVESMQNGQEKKKSNSALEAKMQEALEKSQKPRDPNDFSYKNGGFGGVGLGYMMGEFEASDGTKTLTEKATGLNIALVGGNTKFFTKMHGIRYYFDINLGFVGDSGGSSNTTKANGQPWIAFNVGGSLDYLIDFTTIQMMNSGWNIGAFAGVNLGLGLNLPYTAYCENGSAYCYNPSYGYTSGNMFSGTSYGFQFGLKVVEDKQKASGLEIGYKYRRFGGKASWKEVWGDTAINYDGGMIYALYTYRI